MLRQELTEMMGRTDRYLAQIDLSQVASANRLSARLAEARENADVRGELLERGMATEQQLDDAGLWSHNQLDQMDSEGKLAEALLEGSLLRKVQGGVANLARKFEEKLHPRDREGQWRDAPGGGVPKPSVPTKSKFEQRVEALDKRSSTLAASASTFTPAEQALEEAADPSVLDRLRDGDGPVEKALRSAFNALGVDPYDVDLKALDLHCDFHEGTVKSRLTVAGANVSPCSRARGVDFAVHALLPGMLREKHPALAEKLRRTSPRWGWRSGNAPALPPRSPGQGTAPNDPGFDRTSQATLLQYVREAVTAPRTVELYSEVRSTPNGPVRVYDASRKELHEAIISDMLEGVPAQESPRVLFSGGGYAAGKGSVLKLMAARGDERLPQDALVIDPDRIKAQLPEFADTLADDPQANLRVYEEAWDIAQELQARAQEAKLNVVVDGISDTSPDEMLGRVKSFREQGYSAHAFYVSIPTEVATQRAYNRAINAEDAADRRFVPKVIMRAVHRDVSATLPGVLDGAADLNLTVDIYDNDVERGAEPVHVLTTVDGAPKVLEGQDETWAQILAKGQERIEGVDASKRGRDAYGKLKKEGEA